MWDMADIELADLKSQEFDLAIFASGYESRCIEVSKSLVLTPRRVMVLGFEKDKNKERRARHDKHFSDKWGAIVRRVPTRDDAEIYRYLTEVLRGVDIGDRPLRVLVDYSSMTRTWYAALLNWFRFGVHYKKIDLVFCYCPGTYTTNDFQPISVDEVIALPGFEGRSATLHKSIAIFGLGFEALVPLSLLDKLQPDEIFSILAVNSAKEEYLIRARQTNREILELSRDTLLLPLSSVSVSVKKLAELLAPYIGQADVTYIPVGPKPHVLTGLLLSMVYDDVTVLHIRGDNASPEDVKPCGALICTKVSLSSS